MSRLYEQALAEAPRPAILVPPRPNPGPEPWSNDFPGWLVLIPAGIGLGLALAAWRRRRRRGAKPPSPAAIPVDDSPEARLLAVGESLRAVLAGRLGPGLRARTTEEILADPQVAELLDDDRDRLAAILVAGDRIKFAPRGAMEGFEDRLDEWASWAGNLEASLGRP